MGSTTRRIAVALAAAGLIVSVGCAKDETVTATSTSVASASSGTVAPKGTTPSDEDKDKGSGEYAEACSIIQEIDAAGADEDVDTVLSLFPDARDASPDELAEHWDVLAGVFEQLATLGDSPEDITAAFELFSDPAFLEAAKAIDDFAQDECGLDIDLDPSGTSPGGRIGDDEIGAPTDSTDPDDDPTSIDSLQAHLEKNYGTEVWWPVLDDASSWSSTGVGDTVEWEITLSGSADAAALLPGQVVDACDAIADYLVLYETDDLSVKILDASDEVLAVRDVADQECSTP